MKRLLGYLKEHLCVTILAPLFKMLEASFELFVPLVVASMIDVGIGHHDIGYLWKMGGLLILQVPNGKREAISIFGTDYDTKDGTCVRDYIHVTDLAQAHILAVKYLMEGNESNIFNLGNGVGFTVKEVIETARKVTGKPIKAVEEGRRAGDPAVLIASSEKAKNILGWKPEHADLEEIIASAWKWHSSHPQGYCSVQKEDK